MALHELTLDEISERIVDSILDERYLNRKTIILKIRPLLKTWLIGATKPKKTNYKSADTHKLQWSVAKQQAERDFWHNKLKDKLGVMPKDLYSERDAYMDELGFNEYKKQ